MYAKCRCLKDACNLLDKMPEQTLVAWNAILGGYAQNDRLEDAREVFNNMPERNIFSWTTMVAGLVQGRRLHDARVLFEEMPERNVVSWTAMIFPEWGCEEALALFYRMQRSGTRPNQFTFNSVLSTCANLGDLELSNVVYGQITKMGLDSELSVCNALVNLYVKLGYLDRAKEVFEKMSERDAYTWTALLTGYTHNSRMEDARYLFDKMLEKCVVSWSAMIAGYSQNDSCEDALKFFVQMLQEGVKPNQSTLASVLSSCGALVALESGIQVHVYIIKTGFESDVFARSALVDMYAKCGNMECAKRAFDTFSERNVVSWNSMFAGYAQNKRIEEAFELFTKMPEQNLVSWNSMIAGYCQNEQAVKAQDLFSQMQMGGWIPDQCTYTSVLSSCAATEAMEQGKQTHAKIIGCGLVSDVLMGSALVAMYAKCGSIEYARHVFDKMHTRNVVSWTIIILGYAQHGHGKIALQLFDEMQQAGMKPNHITFVGVLIGCNHAGLVDEGWNSFTSMSRDYYLAPREEHYACMVDILCRAGHLNQAEKFINDMPFQPDSIMWHTLLSACRKYVDIDLGERTAERLFEMSPENSSPYIMLSNIYAAAGRWSDVAKVRQMMNDRAIKRSPGCSWIDVKGKVHAFLVGDKLHPQRYEIYEMLERLSGQIKEAGHVPETNRVLHDVEEELKENIISHHSEKLAITFGLLNLPLGKPIRILKNLRVCSDCHNAIKFISKIVQRQIVVRDASRFHHFQDGLCSCGDYW
ncbi:LOW QUALITY PROTEIN: pentatricopeptide repeat-containing protein At4g02750 [Cryptomeria japonica]|uniref:LOW QUALITY PROTEIN: pentatricopeptide repeat-containing protein At4g02750 n=1 Tax=Cryptomeria japonica TaxID=3369 RepID=UPI0027DA98AA|nr:LOW QUALITY PROTEIN: pentatricopeptide repeat-containing protein At4g02750 [Cryptomeria japonica]